MQRNGLLAGPDGLRQRPDLPVLEAQDREGRGDSLGGDSRGAYERPIEAQENSSRNSEERRRPYPGRRCFVFVVTEPRRRSSWKKFSGAVTWNDVLSSPGALAGAAITARGLP